MQKVLCLQAYEINDNEELNKLLNDGWKVESVTPGIVAASTSDYAEKPYFVFVLSK